MLPTTAFEAQIVYPDPLDDSGDPAVLALPLTHNIDWRRVYPRRFGFFSRKGICAVSVPAFPQGALDDLEGAHAVFSMFSDDAVPGGVAAAQQAAAAAEDQPTAVSSKEYFFVEGWLSYDITGLSDATPNEAPAGPRLSPSEQNSRYRAVDLAVGRRGVVQDYISPPALMRGVAQRVFQRVKLLTKVEIVDVASLCQPCHVFPYLKTVEDAKMFFRKHGSKWDAEQWLVCTKLY